MNQLSPLSAEYRGAELFLKYLESLISEGHCTDYGERNYLAALRSAFTRHVNGHCTRKEFMDSCFRARDKWFVKWGKCYEDCMLQA